MEMHEPFFLKIRTQVGGTPACITAKVMPSLVTMETVDEWSEWRGGLGSPLISSFRKEIGLDFGLKLRAVEDKGSLCTIETIET